MFNPNEWKINYHHDDIIYKIILNTKKKFMKKN